MKVLVDHNSKINVVAAFELRESIKQWNLQQIA